MRMQFVWRNGKGAVFTRKAVQNAKLATRRTYLTHVGVVCDQPDLQRLLPQYILGNERTLPARAMVRLNSKRPGYVRLIRRKKAWMDKHLFVAPIIDIMAGCSPIWRSTKSF